jgi:hypothetical protein
MNKTIIKASSLFLYIKCNRCHFFNYLFLWLLQFIISLRTCKRSYCNVSFFTIDLQICFK